MEVQEIEDMRKGCRDTCSNQSESYSRIRGPESWRSHHRGDRGELEPREMTLLDMTLRQAAEILKTISIHTEYTPQIRTLTESIVQRILPEMQSPAAIPTIDNGKEDILQNVVCTMERLTSRINAMESCTGRPDQAQATGRSWAEEMDEMDMMPTHTTTTSRKDAHKDTPNTSTATSKPITP